MTTSVVPLKLRHRQKRYLAVRAAGGPQRGREVGIASAVITHSQRPSDGRHLGADVHSQNNSCEESDFGIQSGTRNKPVPSTPTDCTVNRLGVFSATNKQSPKRFSGGLRASRRPLAESASPPRRRPDSRHRPRSDSRSRRQERASFLLLRP